MFITAIPFPSFDKELITELTNNDTELLEKIQKQKEEIEQAKTELENSKKELDTSKATSLGFTVLSDGINIWSGQEFDGGGTHNRNFYTPGSFTHWGWSYRYRDYNRTIQAVCLGD